MEMWIRDLRKVEGGEYDAIVLSKAGLDRLGWSQKITEALSTDDFASGGGTRRNCHRIALKG